MRASALMLRVAHLVDVTPDDLCQAAGVDLDDDRIVLHDVLRLWQTLAERTGNANVGLTCGRRMTVEMLGPVGPAIAMAPDLRHAIEVLAQLFPHLVVGADFEVRCDDEGGELRYRMLDRRSPHSVDLLFASILSLARECTGTHVVPELLELECPVGDADRYRRHFGVVPSFGAPVCRMRFSDADLDRPFRFAEPSTSRLLAAHASTLLGTGDPFLARLESALLRSLERRDGSLLHTASVLGVPSRTLQRQLQERDTSFSEVKERVFRHIATAAIRDGASTGEIARRLGYASRRAFVRAFRSWLGMTPAEFRTERAG
ncbi:MAG: AraC family transcriptional regulator ligand-binding domain-containing protein [Deltaproteobacteria bacterium]|nr:AraC family transcriptional regulator ligand-binding domain-containing protein [Deltaproteobacteria bacterium]